MINAAASAGISRMRIYMDLAYADSTMIWYTATIYAHNTKNKTDMTHEDYCSYDLGIDLKVAGFDWPCRHYYTKENAADDEEWMMPSDTPKNWNDPHTERWDFFIPICSAPTLAVANKWLREVCKVLVEVNCFDTDRWGVFVCRLKSPLDPIINTGYDTYESALADGIAKALELLYYKQI